MMKLLFVDESGDHSLSVIDPQYPMFVLGGIIIEKHYADGELTRQLDDFKQRLFGHNGDCAAHGGYHTQS